MKLFDSYDGDTEGPDLRTPEERKADFEKATTTAEQAFGRIDKLVSGLFDKLTARLDKLDADLNSHVTPPAVVEPEPEPEKPARVDHPTKMFTNQIRRLEEELEGRLNSLLEVLDCRIANIESVLNAHLTKEDGVPRNITEPALPKVYKEVVHPVTGEKIQTDVTVQCGIGSENYVGPPTPDQRAELTARDAAANRSALQDAICRAMGLTTTLGDK